MTLFHAIAATPRGSCRLNARWLAFALWGPLAISGSMVLFAEPPELPLPKLPLVFAEDFENGDEAWKPTDSAAWKVADGNGGHVYSLFQQSTYEPPHRSPVNFSLLDDVYLGDFVLDAQLKSTVADYGHRDMCLVFGYQDAAHFYYVHFGKQTDDHANQVFVVNDAPRTKISTRTSEGTNWDDAWHRVRIVRKVDEGTIEVYFDDFESPVMTAQDTTFAWGQVGIGSFDDTGDWDNIRVRGVKVKGP